MTINKDSPIGVIDLSSRLENVLKSEGLYTAECILSLDRDSFSSVKGVGAKLLGEIDLLRSKPVDSWPVRKKATKKQTILKRELSVKIVKKLIKEDCINYSRDIAIFNKVFDLVPDEDFWLWMTPKYKSSSFAAYLSVGGKIRLKDIYGEYVSNKRLVKDYKKRPSPPILEKEKLGEDLDIQRKPRNFKDLIKWNCLTRKT